MRSSTSNSEATRPLAPGLPAIVVALVRQFWPAALATVLLFALAAGWSLVSPPIAGFSVEDTVTGGQYQRANTIAKADVLIIGDSSCLMGADAKQLSHLLGKRVTSLCSMADVGAAGFAELYRRYTARHGAPTTVIVGANPAVLHYGGAHLQTLGYEAWVLHPHGFHSLGRLRRTAYNKVLHPVFPPALPGTYGKDYGFPDLLLKELNSHQGSLREPNQYTPPKAPQHHEFVLSDDVAQRVTVFGEALRAAPPQRLLVWITPVPEALAPGGHNASRDAVAQAYLGHLNTPQAKLLPMAPYLPDDLFANPSHLNARGQDHATRLLADALQKMDP